MFGTSTAADLLTDAIAFFGDAGGPVLVIALVVVTLATFFGRRFMRLVRGAG